MWLGQVRGESKAAGSRGERTWVRASTGEAGRRHCPVSANDSRQITVGLDGEWPDSLQPGRHREVGHVSEAHGQQGKRRELTGQVNPRRVSDNMQS